MTNQTVTTRAQVVIVLAIVAALMVLALAFNELGAQRSSDRRDRTNEDIAELIDQCRQDGTC